MNRRTTVCTFSALALLAALIGGTHESRATPKPRSTHSTAAIGPRIAAARSQNTVEVLWGGQWWKAQIIGVRGGFTKIHYVGWSSSYDEWVQNHRVRAPSSASRPQGRSIMILWGGKWWPGTELATQNGLHKVHYTGWSSTWDQWVEPQRIRPVAQMAGKP